MELSYSVCGILLFVALGVSGTDLTSSSQAKTCSTATTCDVLSPAVAYMGNSVASKYSGIKTAAQAKAVINDLCADVGATNTCFDSFGKYCASLDTTGQLTSALSNWAALKPAFQKICNQFGASMNTGQNVVAGFLLPIGALFVLALPRIL